MAWRPGQRAAQRTLEAPFEDVPDHLRQPLWDWIQPGLYDPYAGDRTVAVAIHLRISVGGRSGAERLASYLALCNAGELAMLDLVEALLELFGFDSNRAATLKSLLRNANSAYDVNDRWDGLVLRVTPEVKDQVQAVVDTATGSPGDHLRDAWNEAYGRTPDPVKSYSESIKAVESALAPIVSRVCCTIR